MGLFKSRRVSPLALTPEAVAAVLLDAGFEAAQMDATGYRPVTEGFVTYVLPVAAEDRVGVTWHASPHEHDDYLAAQEDALNECGDVLEGAGYQAEFVMESTADYYLVVWVEGEF